MKAFFVGMVLLLVACDLSGHQTTVETMAIPVAYIEAIDERDETALSKTSTVKSIPATNWGHLSQLRRADTVLYLFGYPQVAKSETLPLHPSVSQAIENAELFLFEQSLDLASETIAQAIHNLLSQQTGETTLFVAVSLDHLMSDEAPTLIQWLNRQGFE